MHNLTWLILTICYICHSVCHSPQESPDDCSPSPPMRTGSKIHRPTVSRGRRQSQINQQHRQPPIKVPEKKFIGKRGGKKQQNSQKQRYTVGRNKKSCNKLGLTKKAVLPVTHQCLFLVPCLQFLLGSQNSFYLKNLHFGKIVKLL